MALFFFGIGMKTDLFQSCGNCWGFQICCHIQCSTLTHGCRWVTTPSWLSRALRPFLYSSVHSYYHLFLISCSSASLPFLFFIMPIFAWNVPLVAPIFLKRTVVFPILLFSSISLYYSLKAFLSLLAILSNCAFSWMYLYLSPLPFTSLLSSAIHEVSRDNHFAFLHFFFLGMVFVTASYTKLWSTVHSSSGTIYQL